VTISCVVPMKHACTAVTWSGKALQGHATEYDVQCNSQPQCTVQPNQQKSSPKKIIWIKKEIACNEQSDELPYHINIPSVTRSSLLSQGTAVTVLNTPSILIQFPALTTTVVVTTLADIRIVAIPTTIVDINRVE
jgi:hypothetical protein